MMRGMKLVLASLVLAACAGDGDNATEGKFSFAWQVTANGQVIDCATAGIETVRVVTDNGTLTTETFLCTDGAAVSGPRDVGPYMVTVSGLDGGDAIVATSSDQGSVLGGQTVDLGVFPLETASEICDASSCATGCCDDTGACVDPQTDAACGRAGVACADCTGLGQVCNTTEGLCIE